MKELVKSILSQRLINIFYHLPKAVLANMVYGFPTKGLKVIGVTGTDGKTTTTNMIYQILKAAGKKVSMVSTINAVIGGKSYETGFHVTSPDPFMVQKFAKAAKDEGDEYLILEVTSHALDQNRFWGINFYVGVITNITHEHLDYHKTFENYLRTKWKLLKDVRFAVINYDLISSIKQSYKVGTGKLLTFGLDKGDFSQKDVNLKLKIPGEYNIENALAALAVAFALEIDRKIAQKALENFKNLTGRMEEIENRKGIKIIVDFAHTPNALEQALKTLRSSRGPKDQQTTLASLDASRSGSGKLIAVFGSAGKRDVAKRSLMGKISAQLADITVVTAEDPRGELKVINRQIVEGAESGGGNLGKNLFVIEDRGQAIDFAVNELAQKGDTVGIFGKGHEASMNINGKNEIPWSDREAARGALDG